MYTASVKVKGTSPLLQHRFPMPDYDELVKGGQKSTGEKAYHEQWRSALYVNNENEIYQPAVHFEQSMIKASTQIKIKGKRGKTYKDLFKAAVFVSPEEILHGVKNPDELSTDPDERLYIDVRPVVIQRARVAAFRPAFKAGWILEFEIEVTDDEIPENVLQDVLTIAGRSVGIGDYRPRFGRFSVVKFEVHK